MCRPIALFGASLVTVGVVGVAYWTASARLTDRAASNPHPRAVLCFNQREFGTVRQGEMLLAQFPIRNAGNRRLVVSRQGKPCCDPSADVSPIIVKPGEMRLLNVRVDTMQWFGQLSHSDRFTTNDPSLPSFELTVRGVVKSD